MEPEEGRSAAELRKLNAETAKLEAEARKLDPEASKLKAEAEKLKAEADKLEAEAWQIQFSVPMDAAKVGLAVFAAGIALLEVAERLGWL